MIWLLLSISLSAALVLIFRAFPGWGVKTPNAILVNYATCFVLGNALLGDQHILQKEVISQAWFWPSVLMGLFFITVFNAMGWSARTGGASLTALASKMGLIIPVAAGILLLNEPMNKLLIPGIALCIAAIWLLNPKIKESGKKHDTRALLLMLFVFVGSGLVDTGLKLIQHAFMPDGSMARPTTLIFSSALLLGIGFQLVSTGNLRVSKRDIPAGLLLGVFNYFSVFALLKALDSPGMTANWFFPMNNLGVVLAALLLSALIFKERLSKRQLSGVGLAMGAILLLSL